MWHSASQVACTRSLAELLGCFLCRLLPSLLGSVCCLCRVVPNFRTSCPIFMSYFVFIQSWGIFQKPGDKSWFLVFVFFFYNFCYWKCTDPTQPIPGPKRGLCLAGRKVRERTSTKLNCFTSLRFPNPCSDNTCKQALEQAICVEMNHI